MDKLGIQCQFLQLSIRDRAACKQILEEGIAKHGSYYGVICNTGITQDSAFPALSDDNWDAVSQSQGMPLHLHSELLSGTRGYLKFNDFTVTHDLSSYGFTYF
ncbi:3-oxoacyl-[ACP] reductase [hydrothermal vent metagenome]|uniref:3-oxoacyl-[ACP] reductase n=1 Tax=hydrothermal vent metagenome TaxID=652676 RepID=A0A3B0V500_9ZZZZ